jgi:ankyrin repeat protein
MYIFGEFSGQLRFVEAFISANVALINATNFQGNTALHEASEKGHSEIVEFLANNSEEIINNKNRQGQTALHLAVIKGHLEVVKVLTDKNADAEVTDCNFRNALYYAIYYAHFEIIKHLAENGVTINSKGKHQFNPLYIAAKKGDLALVKYLVEKGADVNAKIPKYQQTALFEATWKGHLNVVEFLIDKKAQIGVKDKGGSTALHNACTSHGPLNTVSPKCRLDIVKFLVSREAPLRAKDGKGNMPLHRAILTCPCKAKKPEETQTCGSSMDIAQVLIEKNNTLMEEKDKDGNTGLLLALKEGHSGLVNFFLERGANINARDKDLNNAAHVAFQLGLHEHLNQLLENKTLKINQKNKSGDTVFHLALKENQLPVAELLIVNGASIEIKDADGNTALLLMLKKGNLNLVNFLLGKGADINAKDKDLSNAAHVALQLGLHEHLKQFLESKKLKIDEKNKSGDTLLHLVLKENLWPVAELLIVNGASIALKLKRQRWKHRFASGLKNWQCCIY